MQGVEESRSLHVGLGMGYDVERGMVFPSSESLSHSKGRRKC